MKYICPNLFAVTKCAPEVDSNIALVVKLHNQGEAFEKYGASDTNCISEREVPNKNRPTLSGAHKAQTDEPCIGQI